MSPRVLMCITVYNGGDFVPRAIRSAAAVSGEGMQLDILVLDDCSPEPGLSADLAALCDEVGVTHYRTPRNLGIPRNFNLGLGTGVSAGYDYVMLCNSDVVFPQNLAKQLVRACEQDDTLGSVTAFSNNVSVFSLPNADPDRFLTEQPVVDWISGVLEGEFGGNVLDIPSGVGFCMLFPTRVLRDIGLMDPVFGRGYCEEIDWTLRSKVAGYRIGLAPGTFVYHQGGATNRREGLISGDSTTVQAHEEIIDFRYPVYRTQLTAFESSGLLGKVHRAALDRIFRATGGTIGYLVDVGWVRRHGARADQVQCVVAPSSRAEVLLQYRGFEHRIPFEPGEDVLSMLQTYFGRTPDRVTYDGTDRQLMGWGEEIGFQVDGRLAYPASVSGLSRRLRSE